MITKYSQIDMTKVYEIANEIKPIIGNYGNRGIGCCALGCLKLYVKEQSQNPESNIYIDVKNDYISWNTFVTESNFYLNTIAMIVYDYVPKYKYYHNNSMNYKIDVQELISTLNDFESREAALFILENFLNW